MSGPLDRPTGFGDLPGPRTSDQTPPALTQLVERAFAAFDDAVEQVPLVVVKPAVPVLFFGDLSAYRLSPLRIVTVGLNPSLAEFPIDSPFRRFRRASSVGGTPTLRDTDQYIDALSGYFRSDPYSSWFRAYAALLDGMAASFYDGRPNTALHTDICSPVATSPTWSGLMESARSVLLATGRPLWHDLIRELRPHVILMSVARQHLNTITLPPAGNWTAVHRVERSRPYVAEMRRYLLDADTTTALVFGKAAQTPFGLVGDAEKRRIGAAVKEFMDA